MFFPRILRDVDVIHSTSVPLLALHRYDLALDGQALTRVREELIGPARDQTREQSFRSGFLLGVEADPVAHPACHWLAGGLRATLLAPVEQREGLEFSLSFLKLAEGEPPAVENGPLYEGPHLDTHPQLSESIELTRLLVNLSRYPRRFLYGLDDRWRLTELGVDYGRREFRPLVLPEQTQLREVVLPGRTDCSVHGLRFLASAIPHVGLNDPPEHFLISFEALMEVEL